MACKCISEMCWVGVISLTSVSNAGWLAEPANRRARARHPPAIKLQCAWLQKNSYRNYFDMVKRLTNNLLLDVRFSI